MKPYMWVVGALVVAGVVFVFIVYPFCKLLALLDEEEEQRYIDDRDSKDNWGMG